MEFTDGPTLQYHMAGMKNIYDENIPLLEHRLMNGSPVAHHISIVVVTSLMKTTPYYDDDKNHLKLQI